MANIEQTFQQSGHTDPDLKARAANLILSICFQVTTQSGALTEVDEDDKGKINQTVEQWPIYDWNLRLQSCK